MALYTHTHKQTLEFSTSNNELKISYGISPHDEANEFG